MPGRLLETLALALVLASTGCDGCAGEREADPARAAARKPRRSAARADLVITPVAAAVLLGDKAMMWTDGRAAVIAARAAAVGWTEAGFEWPHEGGMRVLAPGGTLFWRPGGSSPGARALTDLATAPRGAPDGYAVLTSPGRGGLQRFELTGPEGRLVRVGMHRQPPGAVVWLEGVLPKGVRASPGLDREAGWKRAADGLLLNEVPEGALPLAAEAPTAAALDAWAADLAVLRGAPVSVAWSAAADLDGDGAGEGFLCVLGGEDDQDCYADDPVGEVHRYLGLNLHWAMGADSPFLFERDGGGRYLARVGPLSTRKAEGRKVVHLVRFDGTGWTTEIIR